MKRAGFASKLALLALVALLGTACGRIVEDDPATPTRPPTSTAGPAVGLRALPQETPVRPPEPTAPPFESFDHASQPTLNKYLCDEGRTFEAWVFPRPSERAVIVIGDQTNELRQQPAGSGISYADASMTFRAQGPNAFIEEGGQMTYRSCRAQ